MGTRVHSYLSNTTRLSKIPIVYWFSAQLYLFGVTPYFDMLFCLHPRCRTTVMVKISNLINKGKWTYAPVTLRQRPRRMQYVLEVLINVAETFLNLKINLAFPVHTTTKLSFHHVYHVRCRLLLRAGSSSKYVHHVFATSSIRPYNSHYDLSTFLSRQS